MSYSMILKRVFGSEWKESISKVTLVSIKVIENRGFAEYRPSYAMDSPLSSATYETTVHTWHLPQASEKRVYLTRPNNWTNNEQQGTACPQSKSIDAAYQKTWWRLHSKAISSCKNHRRTSPLWDLLIDTNFDTRRARA